MEAKKLLYIQTFGCQMNDNDARRMAEVLRPSGFSTTTDPRRADLILVNTCSVREKSQAKVLSVLGMFRPLKIANPDLVLGVAGCVAEQEGARIIAAAPFVDLVFGPDHIASLPEMVERARTRRIVQTGFVEVTDYEFLRAAPVRGEQPPTAIVTIQKGCDNHCSYCIVPRVRGREVSRPAAEILAEVRDLVAAGAREVTLIGQNVNSYRGFHNASGDFAALLREVDHVPGLQRIRFTTSHPKDFGEELVRAFADLERLCPSLHLPIQSGSTRVLESMNRGYTREGYLEIIDRVRAVRPEVAIGTDIIVGFPGETDADHDATISLLQHAQYDYIYSFKYSVRPGTPAEGLGDDVLASVKSDRLQELQRAQEQITRVKLSALIGRTVEVLVEGPSRRGPPQMCGRDPGNHAVNFEARDGLAPGTLIDVEITEAGSHTLRGRIATGQVTGAREVYCC